MTIKGQDMEMSDCARIRPDIERVTLRSCKPLSEMIRFGDESVVSLHLSGSVTCTSKGVVEGEVQLQKRKQKTVISRTDADKQRTSWKDKIHDKGSLARFPKYLLKMFTCAPEITPVFEDFRWRC